MQRILRDFSRNRLVYAMMLPVVVYYLLFHYVPIYGVQIAFKDYSPMLGFLKSPWAGFVYFEEFFNSYYFVRLLKNTFLISLYSLIFAFPSGIILALLLNEVKSRVFKRSIQTITYMPHFISIVVVVGIMFNFLARDGIINNMLVALFGIEPIAFMREASWFRTIYITSDIWQGIGWSSIIYLAAISGIDPALYEAAKIDGAGRWRQVLHVSIPGILPVTTILLILQIGSLLSVGDEKILLMYNPVTYETADVIGTFVYRKGILEASFSYSAAVGLFKSVISFMLLVMANAFARKVSENNLW